MHIEDIQSRQGTRQWQVGGGRRPEARMVDVGAHWGTSVQTRGKTMTDGRSPGVRAADIGAHCGHPEQKRSKIQSCVATRAVPGLRQSPLIQ